VPSYHSFDLVGHESIEGFWKNDIDLPENTNIVLLSAGGRVGSSALLELFDVDSRLEGARGVKPLREALRRVNTALNIQHLTGMERVRRILGPHFEGKDFLP